MAENDQGRRRRGGTSDPGADAGFPDLLGRAVADCWGDLPKEVQQRIYETAVGLGCPDNDELCRERLAVYLHNRHPRTERKVQLLEEVSSKTPSGVSEESETELDSRRWRD